MNKKELFEDMPISKAIMSLAGPTIISQLINLVYNLTDTFYVGRTGDAYKIAGVSISFTIFMIMVSISNIFGIGGGSLISRLLGTGENDRAKKVSSFSFWCAIVSAAVYAVLIGIFMDPILRFLGASDVTINYAKQYTEMVVVAGGIPFICSTTLSHIVRCLGYAKQASIGLSGGGILNMILDPLFMFVLFPDGMEVFGAAFATCLSNVAAAVYFIIVVKKIQNETCITLNPKEANAEKNDIKELFSVGIPSGMLTLTFDLANMVLNMLMAVHGDLQLAAMGIILKCERIPNCFGLGIAQGMLPIVAYNYASGNRKRRDDCIKYGRYIILGVSAVCIVIYELFAPQLINIFLSTSGNNAEASLQTIDYGVKFLRLRCLSAPFMVLNIHSSYSMQAVGNGKGTLLHCIIRQIGLYIPCLFILDRLLGEIGLALALPIAEAIAAVIGIALLTSYLRKVDKVYAVS